MSFLTRQCELILEQDKNNNAEDWLAVNASSI